MEIIPQVHLLSGSFVNFYLIVELDGLTLIDTGLSRHRQTTLRAISRLGRSPADLKRIVITHSDGDHVGALADLKAARSALACARAEQPPVRPDLGRAALVLEAALAQLLL